MVFEGEDVNWLFRFNVVCGFVDVVGVNYLEISNI